MLHPLLFVLFVCSANVMATGSILPVCLCCLVCMFHSWNVSLGGGYMIMCVFIQVCNV